MADNPLDRMQAETRASYEKVKEAGNLKIQANEAALGRQQQGISQGAQMLQQEGQFQQQQKAGAEQAKAEREQKQGQFETEVGLKRQEMAQNRTLEERRLQQDFMKAGAEHQRGMQNIQVERDRVQQQEREAQLQHEDRVMKQRYETSKDLAASTAKAKENVLARQDHYSKVARELSQDRGKLVAGQNDKDLKAVLTGRIIEDMAAKNAPVAQARKNIIDAGNAGKAANPLDVQLLNNTLKDLEVQNIVDRARELGEFPVPSHLNKHPDILRMRTFIDEAAFSYNSHLHLEAQALAAEGDESKIALFNIMHGDLEENDRRVTKAAARAIRAFHLMQASRSKVLRTTSGGGEYDQLEDFGQGLPGQGRLSRPRPGEARTPQVPPRVK